MQSLGKLRWSGHWVLALDSEEVSCQADRCGRSKQLLVDVALIFYYLCLPYR